MKGDNNNQKKSTEKHGNTSIELTAMTSNNEESNDQFPTMSNSGGVQMTLTPIIVNEEQKISPQMNMSDQEQVVATMNDSNNPPNTFLTSNRRIVEIIAQKANLPVKNMISNAGLDLSPIVGYADEPLLPLFKACAPLTSIIPNLSFYVQMALHETPEQPPDELTIDESAAIRLYTIEWSEPRQSLYSMLNYTLKQDDRQLLRPYFKYLKLFLTALAKLPCVPSLTVWRGVTKDLSAEFLPGTKVTWWAFSSCTTELTVLENNMYLGDSGRRTLFSVEAINGRTIRAHSHFVTEDEILLLPGTHMIVQSQFSPGADLHIVHLKQVIPKEVLLEPPFEGHFNRFSHCFSITVFFLIRCPTLSKIQVSLITCFSC